MASLRVVCRRGWGVCGAIALMVACGGDHSTGPTKGGLLALGTWGGDTAAVLASESLTHIHVGCTDGDFPGNVALDSAGHFSVNGTYQLHAYPIAVGPDMPAQFAGQVRGEELTMVVAVNDTAAKQLVVLGPVVVTLGSEPRMGPCPICQLKDAEKRVSGLRAAGGVHIGGGLLLRGP